MKTCQTSEIGTVYRKAPLLKDQIHFKSRRKLEDGVSLCPAVCYFRGCNKIKTKIMFYLLLAFYQSI